VHNIGFGEDATHTKGIFPYKYNASMSILEKVVLNKIKSPKQVLDQLYLEQMYGRYVTAPQQVIRRLKAAVKRRLTKLFY
jgi:hypothetical protein